MTGGQLAAAQEPSAWIVFVDLVDFAGDLITVILGLIAIYGLIRYRGRIALAIRNLRINHIDERGSEIRTTLGEIEALSFSRLTAPQLRLLFGQLNGQLISLKELIPELAEIQAQVHALIHDAARLNDPIKQQIVYHLRGLLRNTKLLGLEEITREIK